MGSLTEIVGRYYHFIGRFSEQLFQNWRVKQREHTDIHVTKYISLPHARTLHVLHSLIYSNESGSREHSNRAEYVVGSIIT